MPALIRTAPPLSPAPRPGGALLTSVATVAAPPLLVTTAGSAPPLAAAGSPAAPALGAFGVECPDA